LLNELGIDSTFGNRTFTPIASPKDEIIQNHASVLNSFDISWDGRISITIPILDF
jgi:hypothetical protein